MKRLSIFVVAVASLAVASQLSAEEFKSGLQPGDMIAPFYVTKCAGATEDGIAEGKNLCYRCMYGGRPQVMVFTRSSGKEVSKLLSGLDKAITKNSDKKLRAFVNFLGEDKDSLGAEAKKLAKTTGTTQVPFVVPNEFENGPENYGINPDADVTVILAEGGKVKASHAVAKAKDLNVKAVIGDLTKILN